MRLVIKKTMKNSKKIKKTNLSEPNNQSPRKMMERNLYDLEVEKKKEELIATLFFRVVIRPLEATPRCYFL